MLNVQNLSGNTDPDATDKAEISAQAAPVVAPDVTAAPTEVAVSGQRISLDQLINLCVEQEASDVHFREEGRVALRVGGKIIFIENIDSLTKEEADSMISAMMPNAKEQRQLEDFKEVDFSYTHSNGVSFRVSVYTQRGKMACVMRMITKNTPSLEELGVPENVKNVLALREGLIVICGAAGSGKSTTTQAMLKYINQNFVKNIVTIENPIEYVFEDEKSMISQREVGKDTMDAESALQSVIRLDANVVMVSDINSIETLEHILNLVETGHLVIVSMLTRDVSQTVERMVSFYPPEQRKRAQDRLASDLVCILAQDLVERQDQSGLIAVFELMFMNQSIRQTIKRGNFVQLRTAIQSSTNEGMITMDNYANELASQGIITQDKAGEYVQLEEE